MQQIILADEAERIASQLTGQKLTHVKRGYGTALLIETGDLHHHPEQDYLQGEYGIMLEWSWRLEDDRHIVCGSWSNDEIINSVPQLLTGITIESVAFTQRIKELYITLSNGLWLASFMTADGNPEWSIRDKEQSWLSFSDMSFVLQSN
jgi:hypothetical protein